MSSSDEIERRLRELKSDARDEARQTEQDAEHNQTQPPGASYGWVPPSTPAPAQPAHPQPPATPTPTEPVPTKDPAPVEGSSEVERPGRGSEMSRALVAGGVAAAVVWLLFAILPFLGSFSGAAGAFVGAFAAVLIVTYLRR